MAPGAPRARRPTADRFELTLSVPADPTSLSVVRHAVAGVATALGLPPAVVADVRLAITEACSAAIRRADDTGSIVVGADLSEGDLRIVVRDGGRAAGPGEGLPLPLVAAITDSVELVRREGGTEVAMTFATPAG